MASVVISPEAAVATVRDREGARLGTFPARVWADGHSPDKTPIVVNNAPELRSAVEQAIGVSRDECGGNGAKIVWAPSPE